MPLMRNPKDSVDDDPSHRLEPWSIAPPGDGHDPSSATAPAWKVLSDSTRFDALGSLFGAYCHAARNRLHTLQFCLVAASGADRDREPWAKLERLSREVSLVVTRLHELCRPMSLDTIPMPLGLLIQERVEEWRTRFAARDLILDLRPVGHGTPSELALDPNRLGQALDGLVNWRAQVCPPGTTTLLGWQVGAGRPTLEWRELSRASHSVDGCERGFLPLAYLGGVVARHGASLGLDESSGFHVRITWPPAESSGRGPRKGSQVAGPSRSENRP